MSTSMALYRCGSAFPGTEIVDGRRKLSDYLACPTIEEYALVDSRSMTIEIYRKERKKWTYEMLKNDELVELISMGVHFPLEDVYEDVVFEGDVSGLEDEYEQGESE